MKVLNKKKRKKYTHANIQKMLKDPIRQSKPYSYLHPQISPTGENFMEDDDALAIVSDAKNRYISNGWMKNRKVSEAAETKSDLTALMSLEGTLTAAVHNAIQGYPKFDLDDAKKSLPSSRQIPKMTYADAAPKIASRVASYHQNIMMGGNITQEHAEHVGKVYGREIAEGYGKGFGDTYIGNIENNPSVAEEEKLAEPDPLQTSPPAKKKKGTTIGPPNMTSQAEATQEAKAEVISEPTPEEPAVEEPEIEDVKPHEGIKKKTRNTQKKKYRDQLDQLKIPWRKSWNRSRLELEFNNHKNSQVII